MRRYTIIVLVIVIIFLFNNIINQLLKKDTIIDQSFNKDYNEFMLVCNNLNINTNKIKNLDSIIYKKLDKKYYGIYKVSKNVIYLDNSLIYDDYLKKIVLYHELGHVLSLEHCHKQCNHIMSSKLLKNEEYDYNQFINTLKTKI